MSGCYRFNVRMPSELPSGYSGIRTNNNDENITYFSGSLENHTIIENVCKILEGGKNAFEKRKRRYNSIASKEK